MVNTYLKTNRRMTANTHFIFSQMSFTFRLERMMFFLRQRESRIIG